MELYIRPAGPADAEEIADIQRICWQDAYRHLLSPASLHRSAVAWNAAHWQRSLDRTDDHVVSLVLDSETTGIAGFGVAGPRRRARDPLLGRYAGEIYLLYLLPTIQHRGHGTRLMAAMARVMLARGMRSALVWALAGNHAAIGFYQRLGGSLLTQCRKPLFGEMVDETALGWTDVAALAGASRNLR